VIVIIKSYDMSIVQKYCAETYNSLCQMDKSQLHSWPPLTFLWESIRQTNQTGAGWLEVWALLLLVPFRDFCVGDNFHFILD